MYGASPMQPNVEGLNGKVRDEAWVATSNIVIGWRQIDAAVHFFNGDEIPWRHGGVWASCRRGPAVLIQILADRKYRAA